MNLIQNIGTHLVIILVPLQWLRNQGLKKEPHQWGDYNFTQWFATTGT